MPKNTLTTEKITSKAAERIAALEADLAQARANFTELATRFQDIAAHLAQQSRAEIEALQMLIDNETLPVQHPDRLPSHVVALSLQLLRTKSQLRADAFTPPQDLQEPQG